MADKTNKKLSFCVAFCGIACALSTALMFTSIIPSLAYAVPAAAGITIYFISEQIDRKWAYLSYLAVTMLSFIIVPEIEADLFFFTFFGYYPTLRSELYRIKNKILRYIAKLAVFNIPVVLTYHALCFILSAEKMLEGMEDFGVYAVYILWGAANVAFVFYDFFLDIAKDVYNKMIKPKIDRLMKV